MAILGKKFFRGAQSTIEYTVLISVLIGALIMVGVYFKRGIQGRWKTATDELSEQLYDPRLADSEITYRTATNAVVDVHTILDGQGYWTMRTDQTNSFDTRSGTALIGGY